MCLARKRGGYAKFNSFGNQLDYFFVTIIVFVFLTIIYLILLLCRPNVTFSLKRIENYNRYDFSSLTPLPSTNAMNSYEKSTRNNMPQKLILCDSKHESKFG